MNWRLASVVLLGLPVFAQNPCDKAFPPITPRGATIFSVEQEGFLGEVAAEQIRRQLRIYPQADLAEPLDRIAARLLHYLPPNEYHFHFSLIELPEANAFAIPGGRIFVSRRLIAFVKDEDELAGVLAHEMGHVVARQASVDMTKAFADVLKVSSVAGKDDILQKFNQLLDNARRKPGVFTHKEDDQLVADQVSLEAASRAGYDPQALAHFLDRLTDNKGSTGGFFSDLFGITRPESIRFRELLKGADAIPASCRETRARTADQEFQSWRKKVAELSPEDLIPNQSTLIPTLRLSPKLRPEISNIKFSPNGKLLIAQDESGISVLRREPLNYLFRIPALGARAGIFNKDSNRVIFQSGGSRIEVWNLESRSRERLWQPDESLHCDNKLPSPDGRVVACVSTREVRLMDLESGAEIARHGANATIAQGEFTSDGSAFLLTGVQGVARMQQNPGPGAPLALINTWAFNLDRRAEMPIQGPLKSALGVSFAFMGADRIAVSDPRDPKGSGVYSWPEGKLLDRIAIPNSPLASVTKGPTILIRPMGEFAVGALSLEDKQIFQVSRNAALDRYEDTGVAERNSGEIGLYPGRKTQPVATLQLPEADLGRLRAGENSPNLDWLALSVRTRGAVWNLKTGQVLPTVPFDGGYISPEGVWTAMLEKTEASANKQAETKVSVRATFDLPHQTDVNSVKFQKPEPGHVVAFNGKYEVHMVTDRAKQKSTIHVNDMTDTRVLWTRELPELQSWYPGNALVLRYDVKSKTAEQILKESPNLKKLLDAAPKGTDLHLLDVFTLDTGKPLGRVLVDGGSGSVVVRSAHLAGRTLFLEDQNNRTLAYSLDTGDRAGQQFGTVVAVDPVRGLAGLQNQPGQIVVVDGSMRAIADFEFPGNIIYAGFDGEGKRLLTVTGAQEVFIENLP